jgi:hypothetical protein
VPRFYFHLFNDVTVHDPEGSLLPNAAVAREMAAEGLRAGRLLTQQSHEVVDDDGERVGLVHYRDVVNVTD